ncbi:MAG TPA: CDGSH iron-sulfur domain-containing protein [Armatimonadota bacterium]|nr:CDGSH iron-sulfur domain-containing protein [Armatimonadota bacterium]
MADCTIKVNENGPYVISGSFSLLDKDGNQFELEKEIIALCRCGQSSNKPFCDGTHKSCGFIGPSEAQALNPEL